MVVVVDEAHWGVNATGKLHKFINGQGVRPNVVTLCVTATPYNVLTKRSRYIIFVSVISLLKLPLFLTASPRFTPLLRREHAVHSSGMMDC